MCEINYLHATMPRCIAAIDSRQINNRQTDKGIDIHTQTSMLGAIILFMLHLTTVLLLSYKDRTLKTKCLLSGIERYLANGPVMQTYTAGQTIDIEWAVSAHHRGHMELFLCDMDTVTPGSNVTQEYCLPRCVICVR